MFETTICTFIPNFTQNEQIMQKLWAKKHPSKGKGTRNRTSGSCNHPTIDKIKGFHFITEMELNKFAALYKVYR